MNFAEAVAKRATLEELFKDYTPPDQPRGGREASETVLAGVGGLALNVPDKSLPDGWRWLPLLFLARQETGHTPSRSHPEYWDGGIPWMGIRDAGSHHGREIFETEQTISPLGLANSSARLLPKGTVCVSRTASVGYVTVLGREMATSQDFATWTCSELIAPRYLMYALLAEGDDIRRFGKGTTHTTIYFPEIRAMHIALPPPWQQVQIVEKLDALSAQNRVAATALTRIETLITRYKSAVLGVFFDSLVLGHETEEGIAISEIATSVFDGPFGSNLKSADYSEEGQRVVRLENVGHLEFLGDKRTFITQEKFESLARHELRPGDIIFSSFIADQIRVCRLPDLGGERAINKADCFCIRVDAEKALGRFVELMLASPASYRSLEKLVHGATRPRINTKQLKGLRVALPPLEEQAEIVDRIEGAFAQIDTLARAAATARARLGALDRAILVRAFQGKLVP